MRHISLLLTILIVTVVSVPVIYGATDGDQPLRIKSKPRVSAQGCSGDEGRALVRVSFESTGKVGDVTLIKTSGCIPFDERIMTAAKEIKFEPEVKDGVPVTVTKLIEYAFNKY